jgi:site-specific DNA-methyltransferase (adenine-specific)
MNSVLFHSGEGEWQTPKYLFDELNKEFHFTVDAAATKENALCGKYWTKEDDAFKQDWGKEVIYLNPPYGRGVGKWVEKAYESSKDGATVVMLLPVRSDTAWAFDYIHGKAEIRFIRGRLKFGHPDGTCNAAPFPSWVVIFRPQSHFWDLGGKT